MIEISYTAISRPLQCYMHLNILFQQYLIQSMPKLVISKVNSVFLLLRPDRVNRSYPPVYRILIFGGVATLPAEASFPLSFAGVGRRKRESLFLIACLILFRINVRFWRSKPPGPSQVTAYLQFTWPITICAMINVMPNYLTGFALFKLEWGQNSHLWAVSGFETSEKIRI